MLDGFSGFQLILLGISVLLLATSLRRMARKPRIVENAPIGVTRGKIEIPEAGPIKLIQETEVRLHDYAREVEGRIESRLALLDQLVLDADREIARLEDMLRGLEEIGPAGKLFERGNALNDDLDTGESQRAA